MHRLIVVSIIVFSVAGCASSQPVNSEPEGKWVWTNEALYTQADAGLITDPELDHAFVVAKNTCKIQALQLPIPSPSCTQPPKQDCSSMPTGFAKGFCQGYNPGPRCDRTAVVAAQEAQVEIYDSCMMLEGWEREWHPSIASTDATDSDTRAGPNTID